MEVRYLTLPQGNDGRILPFNLPSGAQTRFETMFFFLVKQQVATKIHEKWGATSQQLARSRVLPKAML